MGHVVVRVDAQADDGNPDDSVVADREFVLPAGVGHRLGRFQVVKPFDLHHGVVRRPRRVQVEDTVRPTPPDLPVRFGEPESPAELRELDFTEGLRAVRQVVQDQPDELAAAMSSYRRETLRSGPAAW
ncbi:hypothetical protein OG558_02560 [Kribbella sp. NBC_01510]|uniref:hypothetical protein n=1 Tax=Kribbella sp. NBC_01510 TaxID=2903581 RepID=UPI00386966BB